ncbi:MAG: bifunctional 3-deoxy-7-phosphoheptulonate synthase/chorismate mutase type II [Bacteroides sp.]|nr:bifunctional 3-deoxy-7-phosphoheptulonate synthase/chorismate mutase type II [Bacteroides sp.]MCM1378932.1 bifunctional 3-deoxy-7-phosphoheptulonate synthase/chorismate mutase type II [Bacteroides sp.]MCM1445548.1 bifunctional 3-deoxy-7-phosphoheptulonate synthase/chorismate mutase type II [Prevotella sp.]
MALTELKCIYDNTTNPLIIAGPCSAESERQVVTTATELAANGIKILRAGIWKPRTKPGGFEGVGRPGLAWMQKAKELTGMLTATEVATRQHVIDALEGGIDILWIGARTSANPFAMQELADTLSELGATDIPVLVKNPVNPDLELWIGALERLYNAGVHRLGAIHRGFSAYGKHLYRNMPQWHIPIELRRRCPGLPIICDPSHIGGKRELVSPLSQQALDMGFDGLIIESHCEPDCALSDKAQQVTPEVLNYILSQLVIRDPQGTTEGLATLRKQIDEIDTDLVELLAKRMQISREIGKYKKEHRMPVLQMGRHDEIMQTRCNAAKEMEMDPDFMKTVLQAIHEESVRQQLEILNRR